jgi:hypothetical protein
MSKPILLSKFQDFLEERVTFVKNWFIVHRQSKPKYAPGNSMEQERARELERRETELWRAGALSFCVFLARHPVTKGVTITPLWMATPGSGLTVGINRWAGRLPMASPLRLAPLCNHRLWRVCLSQT